MNDKVINEALKLKEELNNSPLIKEYKRLKDIIEHDKDILMLADGLKHSAKLSNDKEEFLTLKKAYENHPLIVDFKEVEEQVKDLLVMLKNIVEDNL